MRNLSNISAAVLPAILAAVLVALPATASEKTVPASGSSSAFWTAAITETLQRDVDDLGARVELVDVRLPVAVEQIPPGTRVRFTAGSEWLRSGRASVLAEARDDRAVQRRFWITAEVRVPALVPVATTRLERGDPLTPGSFELAQEDLISLRGRKPLSHSDLAGELTARRTIPAGEALTLDKVERTVLVRQGQHVSLVLQEGGLIIRAAGLARKNGARGDVIPVSNADTGAVVMAEIRDSRTALVRSGGPVAHGGRR